MTIVGSMGQGVMLGITVGLSIAVANGIWGFFAPSGRTLEQWTADTFLGGKVGSVM